jgi:cell division ATPase FtsA
LLFDASPLLPSAVFAAPGRELLIGADAAGAAVANPAGLEPNPKRRIDDRTVWLGEQEFTVVELIAAVLGAATSEASRVAGAPVKAAVLTHPAAWGQVRCAALTDAALRAGLSEVDLTAEPVAAAAYYATVLGREVPAGRCLLVYDLGAGTFDVSLVQRQAAGFEVIACAGLPDVGGLDLDAALVQHLGGLTAGAEAAWGRLTWPRDPADVRARHALWQGVRAAKERLSRRPHTEVHLPLVDTDVHVTREEFEKVAKPYLDRTVNLAVDTLRTAGVSRAQIAGVFLVGGSSRVPLAATMLHRALGIEPTVADQPELVVAYGSLCVPAAQLTTPAGPATATAAVPRTPEGSSSAAAATDAADNDVRPARPIGISRQRRRRASVTAAAAVIVGLLVTSAVLLLPHIADKPGAGSGATGTATPGAHQGSIGSQSPAGPALTASPTPTGGPPPAGGPPAAGRPPAVGGPGSGGTNPRPTPSESTHVPAGLPTGPVDPKDAVLINVDNGTVLTLTKSGGESTVATSPWQNQTGQRWTLLKTATTNKYYIQPKNDDTQAATPDFNGPIKLVPLANAATWTYHPDTRLLEYSGGWCLHSQGPELRATIAICSARDSHTRWRLVS